MTPLFWLLGLVTLATFLASVLFIGLIVLYITTSPYPDLAREPSERYFLAPISSQCSPDVLSEPPSSVHSSSLPASGLVSVPGLGDFIKRPFPSIADNASLSLSVIVPAYKEESRLSPMLDEALEYLENRRSRSLEQQRLNNSASNGTEVVGDRPGARSRVALKNGNGNGRQLSQGSVKYSPLSQSERGGLDSVSASLSSLSSTSGGTSSTNLETRSGRASASGTSDLDRERDGDSALLRRPLLDPNEESVELDERELDAISNGTGLGLGAGEQNTLAEGSEQRSSRGASAGSCPGPRPTAVSGEFSYEVIVVDDGSRDRTSQVALAYVKRYGADKVRVLTGARNRGKGGAIRLGMLSARGRMLLFADGDGATKFADVELLEAKLRHLVRVKQTGLAMVCGSRAHLQAESIAHRSFFRTLLMYVFHAFVYVLGGETVVQDTQCGFKLCTRAAARILFSNMHIERWAFDVELLYIARRVRMAVGEVAVRWSEIAGSKLVPFFSWAAMAKDLALIRLRYAVGSWRVDLHTKLD